MADKASTLEGVVLVSSPTPPLEGREGVEKRGRAGGGGRGSGEQREKREGEQEGEGEEGEEEERGNERG